MASLDSVRFKIDWAYQHIKALEIELSRHFHGEPRGEIEVDTIIGSLSAEVTPIPSVVPLLIGDCLQNLRSSLDYLVWELVLAAKKKPSKNNQFLICHEVDTFKSQVERGRLNGISDEALIEIERLQPYHCGDKWMQAPLVILDELCNINKHRRLLLTKAEYRGILADLDRNFGNAIKPLIPVGDGATDIGISPPVRDEEEMKTKGQSDLSVVFNEGAVRGEEVCRCLGGLGRVISEWVIPRFERFFE